MTYYAYLHAKPDAVDASGIFYVGKGVGRRCYNLKRNNPHHTNVIRKYGKESIQVSKIECSSEDIAFDLEKGLIKCLRRMGVKLTNMSDGGDGPSGFVRSAESNRLVSEARKGVSWGTHSKSSKAAIAKQTKKVWENPVLRKKLTEAIRNVSDVIGQKSKASWTEKRKRNHAEAVSKRYENAEFRKQASAKASEIQSSAEYRARMSESVKAAWADESLREMQSRNMQGRVWLNNGIKCVRVKENEASDLLAQGWVRGRNLFKGA